jgi:hypothetical protein
MLNLKVVSWSVGALAVVGFVVCAIDGLIVPSSLHATQALEAVLPAFKWLMVSGVVMSLTGRFVYGASAERAFVPIRNARTRRWNAAATRGALMNGRRRWPAAGLLAAFAVVGMAHTAVAQKVDTTAKGMDVPHPFFTHEGLPDPVGGVSLRTAVLATRVDGKTQGDFAFHFETGLTETIGLHIRNDRFLNSSMTEAMFQFVALRSADGASGFAPILEFEFPTHAGAGNRINTLVGQTVKLANSRVAFNEVVHYNPREDMVDGSMSLVAVTTSRFFPVMEVFGEGGNGALPIVRLLAGFKVRVREGLLIGIAYQVPITRNKDFSSQLAIQPDFDWPPRKK